MKRYIIIFALVTACCLSACGNNPKAEKEPVAGNQTGVNLTDSTAVSEKSGTENWNRSVIADALGEKEESKSVRTVMAGLETIGIGKIQSASLIQENGEDVLIVDTENGETYRVYLTGGKTMDAVQNGSTGEWLITSER